jgi:galactose mutarotase-like enzyme
MLYEISTESIKAVINSFGAELISFSDGTAEYIWTGDEKYWNGHNPVLFPTVGALLGLETEIDDNKYQMKKHGFARKSEFELVDVKQDRIIFGLKASEETRKVYPFEFELTVTHIIKTDGFTTIYNVKNTNSCDILFGIGGHTGINCPLYAGTVFEDYYIEFDMPESGPFYYTRDDNCGGIIHKEDAIKELEGISKLNLRYDLFDKDAIILTNLKSQKVRLLNSVNTKGVEFTLNGFSALGIWTPPSKNAPFICIEPWTVTPDFSDHNGKFKDKPNITRLAPQSEISFSYDVVVTR